MNFLEEKIIKDGRIYPSNVLKVDNFLNHQIDINIMRQIADELKRRFEEKPINKILTIEASGIAIATMVADRYNAPVVFAKKSKTINCTDDQYVSKAYSFTHQQTNNVFISRPYLTANDNILIVDDFIAEGEAIYALIDIAKQAGANIIGIGAAIEKGQQNGGKKLRADGFQVESIAIIDSMDHENQSIQFRPQN